MKPKLTSNYKQAPNSVYQVSQQPSCPVMPSRLLKLLNTNTLALLMFSGFALLSTTRGKEPEDTHVTLTTTDKGGVLDNTDYATSPIPTESKTQPTLAAPTLRELLGWIFSALNGDFDDPALAQYAKQQGIDTSANQERPSSSAPEQSSNSSSYNGHGFRRVTAEQKDFGNKSTTNR
jgi:hypothetical protein